MTDFLESRIEVLLGFSLKTRPADHLEKLSVGELKDIKMLSDRIRQVAVEINRVDGISSLLFWWLMELAAEGSQILKKVDPGADIELIRSCTDHLRRSPEILVAGIQSGLNPRLLAKILSHISAILDDWGDPVAAGGLMRRQADILAAQGRYTQANLVIANTVGWLKKLEILNILQQGEYLELGMENPAWKDRRVARDEYVQLALFEASRPDDLIPIQLRAALYHSAARILLADRQMVKADAIMSRAWKFAADSDHSDTRLMIIGSHLNLCCRWGHLAKAGEMYLLGQRIIRQNNSVIPLHRFNFQQNAAGYLYRIGNFPEADRIYRSMFLRDREFIEMDPVRFASVLTSRGLVFRRKGYLRRAEHYHRRAVELLKHNLKAASQLAAAKVHLASTLVALRRFETVPALLDSAGVVFRDKQLLEDYARTMHVMSRYHLHLDQMDLAEKTYREAIKYLSRECDESHDLFITLGFGLAETLSRRPGEETEAITEYRKAETLFLDHRARFQFMRSRLDYSNLYRAALIRNLHIPGRRNGEIWNGVLRVLENDRADLFADSMSYLVQRLNDPLINELYLSFLDLQQMYIDTGTCVDPADLNEKLNEIFAVDKDRTMYSFLSGQTARLNSVLTEYLPYEGKTSTCFAAFVLDGDSLNICIADPRNRKGERTVLIIREESGYRVVTQMSDGTTDSQQLELDIPEKLLEIRTITKRFIRDADTVMAAIKSLPPALLNENFAGLEKSLRRLKRQIRKSRRLVPGIRVIVEACIQLMGLSHLLLKICSIHLQFHPWRKKIHKRDRVLYEILYDLLIRPVETAFKPEQDIILFVSELLSRIPFEALMDSKKDQPYFIFPARTFNYFRSPWLFNHIFSRVSESGNNDSNNILSLFTPLTPELSELRDPYKFYSLIEDGSALSDQAVYRWFKEREASKKTFSKEAPGSSAVLLEAHCMFDRDLPFLSRLMFADGEPLTVLDVFTQYVFDVTGLMVLVACESDQMYDAEVENVGVSIAEAMLCKGVKRMVAPMWTIEKNTAKRVVRKFVDRIKENRRPVQALAEAQREEAVLKSIHPYYWASLKFSGIPG